MEIFFIITLVLALIITSAIISGKNKAEAIKYEKEMIKEPKNNTPRNMALTIIAIGITIITFIMISKEYKEYKEEEAAIKMLNALGMSGKNTEEMIQNSTKIINETNKEFSKLNEKLKKDMEKQMKTLKDK